MADSYFQRLGAMITALALTSTGLEAKVPARSSSTNASVSRANMPRPTQARPLLIVRTIPNTGETFFRLTFDPENCSEADYHQYIVTSQAVGAFPPNSHMTAGFCRGVRQTVFGTAPFETFKSLAASGRLIVQFSNQSIAPFEEAATYRVSSFDEEQALIRGWRSERAVTTAATGSATTRRPAAPTGQATRGAPSVDDVMRAMQASDARYTEWVSTPRPDQMALPSPFGGFAVYEDRSVYQMSCTPAGQLQYRCAYTRSLTYFPAPDSIWGKILAPQIAQKAGPPKRVTHTFVKRGGSWTSPTYDQVNMAWAAHKRANAGRPSTSYSSNTDPFEEPKGGIPDVNGTMCDLGSKSYC